MPSGSSVLGNHKGSLLTSRKGMAGEPSGTFCSLGVVLISHPPMLALSFSNQVRCFLITLKYGFLKLPGYAAAYFGEMAVLKLKDY